MNTIIKNIFVLSCILCIGYVLFIIVYFVLLDVIPQAEISAFVISMALLVLLYDSLKMIMVNAIRLFVSATPIDYQQFMKNFSNILITVVDVNQLAQIIVKTFYDFYELTNASIMIYHESKKVYLTAYACGHSLRRGALDSGNPFVTYLKGSTTILRKDIIRKKKIDNTIMRILDDYNASVSIPLVFENKLIGVLFLGKKKSGKRFTPEDIKSFTLLESQISMAINNAILFKGQKDTYALLAQKNKMDAIIALSGGINHEINNPLTIISMRCQHFLRKLSSGEFHTESDIIANAHGVIEASLRNASRAHGITKRLARFAQPSGDAIHVQPVSIAACIYECVDLIGRKQFAKDNIPIHITIPDECSFIYADPVHFQQVIYNILMNAYHAIEENGIITCTARSNGNARVVLEIHDTGCGIAPENIERIWEPFYTTKPAHPLGEEGKVTGSGLGLSLVKRYLESTGGTVHVKSTLGHGTTFYLILIKAVGRAIENTIV